MLLRFLNSEADAWALSIVSIGSISRGPSVCITALSFWQDVRVSHTRTEPSLAALANIESEKLLHESALIEPVCPWHVPTCACVRVSQIRISWSADAVQN